MLADDCNPALIDPIVSSLISRGVKFRFNCHVRDILVQDSHCSGIIVDGYTLENKKVVCKNCGLLFWVGEEGTEIMCPICGCKEGFNGLFPYPYYKSEIVEADYIISAMQPHQLASLFRDNKNHPMRSFPEFRVLGQFKGADLTVSRIFLDEKVTNAYNLTGLDRDYYSFNGCMDISNVMRRYEERSVFDTLSDDGEILRYYPTEVLKAKIVDDMRKVFPETKNARVQGHLLAHIYPNVLYHRIFPRLHSRFLLHRNKTPLDNFFLAGDWTDAGEDGYQIGLEAAVRSGIKAANCVLESDGRDGDKEILLQPSVAPLVKWFQKNAVSSFIKKRFERKYQKESPPKRG